MYSNQIATNYITIKNCDIWNWYGIREKGKTREGFIQEMRVEPISY